MRSGTATPLGPTGDISGLRAPDRDANLTGPWLIEISKLCYWYPDAESPVLDGVDLRVRRGEMVLLIGSSGGGKSTLVLALNGIVPKHTGGRIAGEVRVAGLDPLEYELAAMATKVGLVFQDPDSQLASIFVRDEVAFGLQNLLLDRATIEARVSEALAFVGMGEFTQRSVFALSGGEKQRVAIASVLAMQPDVTALDEPTANLDPAGAREVARLVTKLRDDGHTLLVVEHQINNLAALADRLVVLDAGRVRFDGPPREVLRDHGRVIRDELGLWIPQTAEFALALGDRHIASKPFPLTPAELPPNLRGAPLSSAGPRPAPRPAGEVIVEAKHVGYSYDAGVPALNDVSCTLRAGEVVALLGQNGSGKTTFASLLVGLRKPGSGRLEVCGRKAQEASLGVLARDVGYVFQYPEHQFVAETVYDDVAYGLRRRGLGQAETEARVEPMLAHFGLDVFRERHPFKLSMGQKRRLSVADMLVTEPRLLILDEPTAGQDWHNTRALIELLNQLRTETGLAILVITHDMVLVADWCQRAIVLDAGRSVFEGATQELFGRLDDGSLATTGLEVPDQWRLARRLWPRAGEKIPLLTASELAACVEEVR